MHYPLSPMRGAPGGSRTPSLRIRSPLLYPIELQAQASIIINWSGKRVSNPRQPAWKASALPTELFPLMVGVRGFEPPAPCSQSRCASQTALHPETKVLYSISLDKSTNFYISFQCFFKTINSIINKSTHKINSYNKKIIFY